MEQVIKGKWVAETYWSMNEIIDTAIERNRDASDYVNERGDRDFMGEVGSWENTLELARKGWSDQLPDALDLAESAVETADKEHVMDSFNEPVWDVTGAQVDVGAYLAGTPECMIDYPLTETSKVGRVVTLVVGVGVNGTVPGSEIIARGQKIVALALALTRLGHAVEIWADDTQKGFGKGNKLFQRILVKGANDETDPAVLLFALAHPAFQRGIKWATWDGLPAGFDGYSIHECRGITRMERDDRETTLYPEGSIFIPSTQSTVMRLSPVDFLRKYLGELGLLAE